MQMFYSNYHKNDVLLLRLSRLIFSEILIWIVQIYAQWLLWEPRDLVFAV